VRGKDGEDGGDDGGVYDVSAANMRGKKGKRFKDSGINMLPRDRVPRNLLVVEVLLAIGLSQLP
jgi:hypothetical protein